MRILRNIRTKVERIFWEAPDVGGSIRAPVAKHEIPRVAGPVMLDHVEVHVEAVRSQDRHASLQLLAGAESRRHPAHLVLRADIVVVEWPVPIGAWLGPGRSLERRRQPQGRKPGLAQAVRLIGKMIPPRRY